MTVSTTQQLPGFERVPNELTLFSFGAATWNQHRIHYDRDYARSEGHRDLIVEGNYQGALLAELAVSFAGTPTALKRLRYRHLRSAYVNETLHVAGCVAAVRKVPDDGVAEIELDLWITVDGERVTQGSALVELPLEGVR
ncbi:hypothetical protein [Dactylosporangium sp. NPDC051484]|uniref:hypothetical protein n=1 Tax=Dactylosporangium sp. NPDC051484 TaxID=3154942 RepID=UPI00344B20BA